MSIEIDEAMLKRACMELIETILICLPNAFKGTIYRVGKSPDLLVERITSGIIGEDRKSISWGLPAKSEYNPPGKPWKEYRDEPGRPLEAMAWCVERQKSWTAEDPASDTRSVRLQVEVGLEDFQHMEPVLVRKSDLGLDMYSSLDYARNYSGDILWKDGEYVVVAVIKIHFRPYTIKIDSHETKVIKKLSRTFGTELLSYQLHQDSTKAMQELVRDRLNACDIIADSLRNAITKSGLIFSLIKQEIGYLREQWEQALLIARDENSLKEESVNTLDKVLTTMEGVDTEISEELHNAQRKFLELSLTPEQGSRWLEMQIEGRWKDILGKSPFDEDKSRAVRQAIDRLRGSLYFGQNPDIISDYDRMPEGLKREWVRLIYENTERFHAVHLDRLIKVLGDPALNIPSQGKSRKTLILLKALAETMNQLERNTNFLLQQVLNGNRRKKVLENFPHPMGDPYTGEGDSPDQSPSLTYQSD